MKKIDNIKQKTKLVIKLFAKSNPSPTTELQYKNPFELLIAVILSAQCTDKRVNLTTPKLFKNFPNPLSMSKASQKDIYEIIKSVTYPNSKAKYLYKTSKILYENYKGIIPNNNKDLEKLPGVGRKTANVILSILHQKPQIAVDTHVSRVSKRIGLVSKYANTPIKVENELVKILDKNVLLKFHHWQILHGRYICKARKPLCNKCFLTQCCNYYLDLKPSENK